MTASSIVFTLLLLAIVGAFIGGITNHLAIKMLFKPYKAIYIGSWRVPFTPGVIPKRHEEIAVQLGNLVMQHLITAEGIEKRFLDDRFKEVIQSKITGWVQHYLSENRPTKEDLLAHFPVVSASKVVEEHVIQGVQTYLKKLMITHQNKTLEELLSEEVLATVDQGLPDLAHHIAGTIRNYFQTDETKAMVQSQLDRFFEGRGMLGNMLNMFLGNQSLVDKFYPDFLKFLERPTVQLTLHHLLEKEWEDLKDMRLEDVSTKLNLEGHASTLIERAIQASPLRELVENPGVSLARWSEPITKTLIPVAVELLLSKASVEAANLLKTLELDQLVSDQVRAFSMTELENVILMISKREFKMITYLGAFLGGFIGIIQAFIMILIQH